MITCVDGSLLYNGLEDGPIGAFATHLSKCPLRHIQQCFGGIKLYDLSVVQHEDSVVVHDCPEAVRNGNNNGVRKFLPDCLLYLLIKQKDQRS